MRDMAVMPEAIEGSAQYWELNEAWYSALAGGWPTAAARKTGLEAALRHARYGEVCRRFLFESDPTITPPAASGHPTAAIDGDIAASER
jgi:hypothetical protein